MEFKSNLWMEAYAIYEHVDFVNTRIIMLTLS